MELSITTDYVTGEGSAKPYLEAIAHAGFSHIHWCHEWNTDKIYGPDEVREIGAWLKETGLKLLDLHASEGREVGWGFKDEARRKAGAGLVTNRIRMVSDLGGGAVVLHVRYFGDDGPGEWLEPCLRSLDEILPLCERTGVKLALENTGSDRNLSEIGTLFAHYPGPPLGLCYDAGHGNFHPPSLAKFETWKHRLFAVHLHDNDGKSDQHKIPFTGTVDWSRVTRAIAGSSYGKCVSLEVGKKNHPEMEEREFLAATRKAAERLTKMIREQGSIKSDKAETGKDFG